MSGEREHDIYTRRWRRNIAVGLGIGALVVLIFAVTIIRLRENVVTPFVEQHDPRFKYRDAEALEAQGDGAAQGDGGAQ